MRLNATPVIPHYTVPDGAFYDIGQFTHAERLGLARLVRAGSLVKVRSSWMGISQLKSVYVPQSGHTAASIMKAIGRG